MGNLRIRGKAGVNLLNLQLSLVQCRITIVYQPGGFRIQLDGIRQRRGLILQLTPQD